MKPTRLFIVALALIAMAFSSRAQATAPQLPVTQDQSGLVGPSLVTSPAMTGLLPCSVEASTPTLVAVSCPGTSGTTGVIYGAWVSSGAVTDLAVIQDVTTANLPAATVPGYDTRGIKISPEIISSGSSATGCTNVGLCGQWVPIYPVRYKNGIAIDRKGTANVVLLYRADPVAPSYALP